MKRSTLLKIRRALKFVSMGAKNSLIIGAPDFSKNNQYMDIVNIGRDFDHAIEKVFDEAGQRREPKNISGENICYPAL